MSDYSFMKSGFFNNLEKKNSKYGPNDLVLLFFILLKMLRILPNTVMKFYYLKTSNVV